MSRLTFYRQKRRDGGLRTAIDVEDMTVLHRFENEAEEADPALEWYVDLRCEGSRLPTDAEGARRWLLNQASDIKKGVEVLRAELEAGMDITVSPLLWKMPRAPKGVRMTIACSAVRRIDAIHLSSILDEIFRNWERTVRSLPVIEPTPS